MGFMQDYVIFLRSHDHFLLEEVSFHPVRTWKSPHTGATYPVTMQIATGDTKSTPRTMLMQDLTL